MPDRSVCRVARTLGALVVLSLLVAACSAGAAPTSSPTAASSSTTAGSGGGRYGGGSASKPSAAATVAVSVASTSLGPVLAGPTGNALYIRPGDSATSSTCTGGCLQAWPALTVTSGGAATAGSGVTGTLATFTRADDGSTQVTYNGMPLYYWQGDTKAGDVTGQNVHGFTVAKP